MMIEAYKRSGWDIKINTVFPVNSSFQKNGQSRLYN